MKSVKELLKAKREGAEWTPDEVAAFVEGVVSGEVSSAQAGAFLMAACIHDLTATETAALTTAMAGSGARFPRGLTDRPSVDKHSTGGVGDKVSLLLAPLAAACGLTVPMISGRGLGHTGGTVDKLESIAGFRTDLPMTDLRSLLQREHLVMAAQSPELAPADRILYGLRDVTGTVENVGLITASILSKKFAEGLDGLVMDIKVGKGAFMQTLPEAQRLAESMKRTAEAAGLPLTVVFTRMDQPLGRAVGNWLEVAESDAALRDPGNASSGLVEVTRVLAGQMLLLGGLATDTATAETMVMESWEAGTAHARFHRMITSQDGSWEHAVQRYAADATLVQTTVEAESDGWIAEIDAMATALGVMRAGGGRMVESDVIDPAVGVVFHATVGDRVVSGQPLATVTERGTRGDLAETIRKAIQTATAPVEPEPSMIIDIWS